MANVPALLKQLPLEHIIGAPLEAAIKAQAMAARTTVDFIRNVGLNKDEKTSEYSAVNVDFKFDRTLEENLPNPVAGQPPLRNFRIVPSKLTVPLLSIVPVPFIRINDMSIDFEYKVRDVETSEHSDELNVQAKASVNYWMVKAQVSGSFTNKNANKRETDQSTSLRITVNAAQDNIPEGLARVLDMLHDQLKVVPLESGTLQPQPTARITTMEPMTVAKNAGNVVLKLTGEKLQSPALEGAAQPVPEDPETVLSNLQETTAGSALSVTVAMSAKATAGEKTIRIQTANGVASAKLRVTG